MLPVLDTVRISLHILAVCVWVGGQLVLAALVPILRDIGGDAPKRAAQRFGQISWPFFGLAVVTGIWNLLDVPSNTTTEYQVTLGIKIVLVLASGSAAFVHTRTSSPAVRGVTGGIGLLAALGALVLGVRL
ncbi:MAG: CopD family protein [Acidimicrobiales bacterium]|nr:CopD family protein [Acidimicrobiales bacterium]MDG1878491.1 CopD family protein [Acidimicrobiales bacterium]